MSALSAAKSTAEHPIGFPGVRGEEADCVLSECAWGEEEGQREGAGRSLCSALGSTGLPFCTRRPQP